MGNCRRLAMAGLCVCMAINAGFATDTAQFAGELPIAETDLDINFLNFFYWNANVIVVEESPNVCVSHPGHGMYGELHSSGTIVRVLKGGQTTGTRLTWWRTFEGDCKMDKLTTGALRAGTGDLSVYFLADEDLARSPLYIPTGQCWAWKSRFEELLPFALGFHPKWAYSVEAEKLVPRN